MDIHSAQAAFALDVTKLIAFIFSQGYTCTLGEVYRTPEQAQIDAAEHKGIIDSLHCQRLAIDLNLFSPSGEYLSDSKEYRQFGIFWESLSPHNRAGVFFVEKYGGHLVDADHFERRL